jgi:Toprim domain
MILTDLLETVETKSNGDEFKVCCPFCPDKGLTPDEGYHLGINVRTGLAHCFRCDWRSGGVINTARLISRALGLPLDLHGFYRTRPELEEKPETEEPTSTPLPLEYEAFRNSGDPIEKMAGAYLRERQVSLLQIVRHRIGYAASGRMSWRVLFPVMGYGNVCYGCVGRDFSGSQEPKYLNTPGVKSLWNACRPGRVAIVVEGIMDGLRVERALMHMPKGMVAVARLGSAITDVQLGQLHEFERVVIVPDFDPAGVHGATALAERCVEARISTKVVVPPAMTGVDPGNMGEDELLGYVTSAVPWSSATALKMRIAAKKEI